MGSSADKPELPYKAEYRHFFSTQVHCWNTLPCLTENLKSLIHKLYRLIFFRDAVDPQPINEIIPSALGIHIIDIQHQIVIAIATHSAILDMILAWLKGESSERKVALGILNELMFYTKEVGVEEQELIVKSPSLMGAAFSKEPLEYG